MGQVMGRRKKTLRQLPELKILIVRKGGGSGYVFSIIFITDLQGLKDVFGGSALGGEVLDVCINGGDRSNGGSGGCGGGECFCVPNLLGVTISFGLFLSLGGLAFICTVSFLARSETESFPYASSAISWEEFLEMN